MSASTEKKPVKNQQQQQEDPDSDLDDLLDDVLDDFNTLSTSEKKGETDKSQGKKPVQIQQVEEPKESSASLDDMFDEDDFAKQLAANMQELMGQMDEDKEMKETFEKIWSSFEASENEKGGDSATRGVPDLAAAAASNPTSKDKSPSGQPLSFQETIAQNMSKLKDSSKQVDSSIAEEGVPDDAFMAEMMRQMESLAENNEFENVLEGMMQQLMSKELLYEPMKDMASKYPDWLKENKSKLSQTEYEKYEKQHELCKQVVGKYDAPNFDEKNETQSREIMDLMQKMQDLGQPPASMLEELAGPGGLNLGPGGIPEDLKDLENCNIM